MNFRAPLLLFVAAGLAAGQLSPDLREAARLDQAGRCEESEAIYRKALAQGEPGPSLLNNLGNHYLVCGQPNQARQVFERLRKSAPLHVNANLQLARLDMESGQFARAAEMLQKLAAAIPGDFDVLYLLGRASARAGNRERARETLEAALRLRPDHQGAVVEAGLANAAAGGFPRAVFLLARAHAQSPDHPAIALALARASEDAGYQGDAVTAYDRYLALRPDDSGARRDRARALSRTPAGVEQGIRQLDEYVTRNPRDPLGHFYLAQVTWSPDADGALASLYEAVRLDPRLAPAHVARAWLLHRVGRDEEALPHLEAALRVLPEDVRALDQLGVVLMALDRPAEAEAALRRAAVSAPDDPDVLLHLGRALIDQGRDEEGQQWIDKYQRIGRPRQRDARSESGMIELATLDAPARRAREIERFRSMARSRPDDPVLQLHLAGLLLAGGHRDEALREYETLLGLNAGEGIWTQAGTVLLGAAEHRVARPFLERAGPSVDLAETLFRTAGPEPALAALDALPVEARSGASFILRAEVLDAAGRGGEAAKSLDRGLDMGPPEAAAARRAALLLAKLGRSKEALALLAGAIARAPADGELLLTEAVVLALSGDAGAAVNKLRRIQTRWPEWDRPWLVHGILLTEKGRPRDAAEKFQAAAALGSTESPSSCDSVRQWAFGTCPMESSR